MPAACTLKSVPPREQAPLEQADDERITERRQDACKGKIRGCVKRVMKEQSEYTENPLRRGVASEEIAPPSRVCCTQPGADGHTAHEDSQHESLSIGGVSKEEFEVIAPHGFIDQSGKSRHCEKKQQEPLYPSLCHIRSCQVRLELRSAGIKREQVAF